MTTATRNIPKKYDKLDQLIRQEIILLGLVTFTIALFKKKSKNLKAINVTYQRTINNIDGSKRRNTYRRMSWDLWDFSDRQKRPFKRLVERGILKVVDKGGKGVTGTYELIKDYDKSRAKEWNRFNKYLAKKITVTSTSAFACPHCYELIEYKKK